jgi:hypothetical protein
LALCPSSRWRLVQHIDSKPEFKTMKLSDPSKVITRHVADLDKGRAMMIAFVGSSFVFGALVVPPILFDVRTHRSLDCDMVDFHLPLINFFIQHTWNLVDYPGYSVSLPGHHILLAWAARTLGYVAVDSATLPIRLLHAAFVLVFSLLFFLFLYRLRRAYSHETRLWVAFALWISVVQTFYFIQSAISISTDLPAATIYLAFLYLTVFYPQAIAAITVSATALVFWRQSYAPVLGAPLLANPDRIRGRFFLTLAVPGVMLLFYIIQFGGFAPPNSIVEHVPEPLFRIGLNSIGLPSFGVFPQSMLHAFAFLGLVSPAYLTIFSDAIYTAYRYKSTVIAASVISLLIATTWIVVPSTFDLLAGRWGSVVWGLARIGPSWGNHSLVVLLLGIIGAAFLAPLMHLAVSRNEIRPILFGMVLYFCGQIFMPLAYQRYIEPVVLMSLALIAAPLVVVSTWRVSLFASVFALYSVVGVLRIYDVLPEFWLIAIKTPTPCS